jgi:diketogulonate reductase-like aldo/keto reductase
MSKASSSCNVPMITLNNGTKIPVIGNGPGILGYKSKIGPKLFEERKFINAIAHSLQIGFSLFDYSAAYGNERLIGKAVHKSGIKRENLFLTTRVSNPQQLKGNIREEFFKTLEYYKTDYVDLYMFHWPVTGVYTNTWKQMEQLYKEGYCKAIGVANCHQHHLEEIFKTAEFTPQINQFEVHPLFTQKALIAYCQSKGITVEAYTPIARLDDRLIRLPALKAIARKYNKSVIQVVLKWHIQNGRIPVVRSLNKKRQLENISIFDFELTGDDLKTIDGFNINSRLRYDPDNCDFSIL